MKHLTLATAIAAVALTGLPMQVSAETDAQRATRMQLAASIGVDPDKYSLLELTQLNCRLEGAHNDNERKRILSEFGGYALLPEGESADSKVQLAAALDVDPNEYTVSELAFLKDMIESDDCNVANPKQWAKAGERVNNETAGAKQQLALSLGVSAEEYTLAELVKMHFTKTGEDK